MFGGLLVLALFSALIGPHYIDWSSHRTAFEVEASRIIGQPVRVRGEADARLLPFPSVTFSDVLVGDEVDPAMTISRFSMDAELAPFLSGEVRIIDMRVDEPKAIVRILEDGSLDWALNRKPSPPGDLVVFENVMIENADITIVDQQNGRTERIENINALVTAGSLSGPWVIAADGEIAGQRGSVTVTTGIARGDGSIRMRVRLAPESWPAVLETRGEARIENNKPLYDGQFTFTAWSEQTSTSLSEQTSTSLSEQPLIVARGDFAATNERLEIEQWRAEVGLSADPYILNGKASVDTGKVPEFLITADGQQINMDRLGDGGSEPGSTQEHDGTRSRDRASDPAKPRPPVFLQERLSVLNALIDRLPPPPLPGRIALNLPAIVAGDTTLREISLNARPDGDAWRIDGFSANLPGRTVVEARGRLVSGADASFNGTLTVATSQPSGLANWLVGEVDPVIRRLGAAGFSANVSLSSALQRFEGLEVAIGAAVLKGRLERHLPTTGRPSLSLELSGDSFDVDAVRALALLAGADQGAAGPLTNYNLAARIKADSLTVGEYRADGVETSFVWRAGQLAVERLLFADLAGASGQFSASLTGVGSQPVGIIEGDISAAEADRLFRLADRLSGGHALVRALAANSHAFGGLKADVRLSLNGADDPVLTVDGETGGSSVFIHAQGAGFMPGGNGPRKFELELENPEVYRLFEQAGFGVLPLEGQGPASLSLIASGDTDDAQLSLQATINSSANPAGSSLSLIGNGKVRRGGLPTGRFKLELESADIEPFAIMFGLPLPQMGTGLQMAMTADLALDDTHILVSQINGEADGNGVSGELKLLRGSDPISGEGALNIDSADLSWFGDLVLGPQLPNLDGAIWNTSPFSQPYPGVPEVQIALNAGRFDLGRAGLATDFSAELTTASGAMSLSDASANWFGGRIGGDLSLSNTDGQVFVLASVSAANADLGALERAVRGSSVTSGGFNATVSLEGSGSSLHDVVGALAGGGELRAQALTIDGVDPEAFPRILDAADQEGFEIDAAAVAAMAADFMTTGKISADAISLPFTLTGGVMRFSSAGIDSEAATLTGDARVDLPELRLRSDWRLRFDPGVEAIAGGDPSVVLGLAGLLVDPALTVKADEMSNYLSMRAFERERRKVELLQAGVVEKQRMRREIALLKERQAQRAAAEVARLAAEEAARLAAEEAAKIAAEEARAAAVQAENARKAREAEARAAARAEQEAARQRAREAPVIERSPLPAPQSRPPQDPPSAIVDDQPPAALPQLRFDDLPGFGDPIRSLILPGE